MSLHCGKCGYNVHGLPSNICPECGSDLDVVGKVPNRYPFAEKVFSVLIYTLWMPIIAFIILTILGMTIIPGVVKEHAYVLLQEPSSRAYTKIALSFNSSSLYFPGTHTTDDPWQTCRIQLNGNSASSITADLKTLTFTSSNGTTRPVSQSTLLKWLAGSGINTSSPQIAEEVRVILNLLQEANNPEWLFAKQGNTVHVTGGIISKSHNRFSLEPLTEAGIDTSPFSKAKTLYSSDLDGSSYIYDILLFLGIIWWARGIWTRWNKPITPDTDET